MAKIIKIEIDETGQDVKVEAEGFEGVKCLEATKDIIDALGSSSHMQAKPEMMLARAKNTSRVSRTR